MVDVLPRYVRLSKGGVVRLGGLAGTDVRHAPVPDGHTGSSCQACFGWADDPRHLTGKGNASQASGSPGRNGGS